MNSGQDGSVSSKLEEHAIPAPAAVTTTLEAEYNKGSTARPQLPVEKLAFEFSRNISSLRLFSENIGPVADQHDEKIVSTFVDSLLDELGMRPVFEKAGIPWP